MFPFQIFFILSMLFLTTIKYDATGSFNEDHKHYLKAKSYHEKKWSHLEKIRADKQKKIDQLEKTKRR